MFDFLDRTTYQGKPLADRLGGWLKQGAAFREKERACYHKEWTYFSNRFKVTCATFIEAKPDIPSLLRLRAVAADRVRRAEGTTPQRHAGCCRVIP